MADIFEYSDIRQTSRTRDQDEEEQALQHARSFLDAPILTWEEPPASSTSGSRATTLLVICTSTASSMLLQHAYPDKKLVGSITFPAASEDADLHSPSQLSDASSSVYAHDAAHSMLSIDCPQRFPAERANAWVAAVLGELQPETLLVAASLQAEMYRGEGDASQETLIYLLETEAARLLQGQGTPALPYLPTGSLVPGLPAAVLTWCQLRGLPAQLVVSVDMVSSLVAHSIPPLAAAMLKLLALQPGTQALTSALSSTDVLAAATRAASDAAELSAMYS